MLASRWVALRSAVPVAWVSFRPEDDGRRIAMRLLSGTDLPIPQIAARCGYRGREQFSRAFAAEVRQSPARYRKQFRFST